MSAPRPKRLILRDTHTTDLPRSVVQEAVHLLATGSIEERLRAAQLLAGAYAEDEVRRLAAAAELSATPLGLQGEVEDAASVGPLLPPGCGSATAER